MLCVYSIDGLVCVWDSIFVNVWCGFLFAMCDHVCICERVGLL